MKLQIERSYAEAMVAQFPDLHLLVESADMQPSLPLKKRFKPNHHPHVFRNHKTS
jgi:hypothetical protein